MLHDFDSVAENAVESPPLDYISAAEIPTFLDVFNNADSFLPSSVNKLDEDKSVCDLACGDGSYTRHLRNLTKGRVIGVDTCYEQLKIARSKDDPKNALHIKYQLVDFCGSDFQSEYYRQFDVVYSVYRLNHASSKKALAELVQNAYSLLKPGGRFIGINISPFITEQAKFDLTKKYGCAYTFYSEDEYVQEGDPIHAKRQTEAGLVESTNYYWNSNTYEDVFYEAGFMDFHWCRMVVNHAPTKEAASAWQDWINHCPVICFSAEKPFKNA